MDQAALASLTDRQRDCLRLVARNRNAKEIGRLLGISPETVNTHIKTAMARLATNSRFDAAQALAEHEGIPLFLGNLTSGMGNGRSASEDEPTYQPVRDDLNGQVLREKRAVFTPAFPDAEAQSKGDGHDLTIAARLLMILCIAVLVGFAISIAYPMSESWQRLANLIDPIENHTIKPGGASPR